MLRSKKAGFTIAFMYQFRYMSECLRLRPWLQKIIAFTIFVDCDPGSRIAAAKPVLEFLADLRLHARGLVELGAL